MAIPMRSFTADRLKPKWADLVVVALLVAAAAALLLVMRPETGGRLTAVVTLDGTEIARQELEGLDAPVLLEIEGAKHPITVEFSSGKVRIYETECPGGDCKATGWVERAGGQIVCLPNRVVISVEGDGPSDIDAVTG